MEVIKLQDNAKSVNMQVSNKKIPLLTIKQYFDEAEGLTYVKDGEVYGLLKEKDEVHLVAGVKVYDIHYLKKGVC